MTPYITSLQPGHQMLFKGPIPKYQYKPNTFDRGLCIAGGAGITPMYQLITYSLGLKEDKTKWTLVFSNVSEEDICEISFQVSADTIKCSGKNGMTSRKQILIGYKWSTSSTRPRTSGRVSVYPHSRLGLCGDSR